MAMKHRRRLVTIHFILLVAFSFPANAQQRRTTAKPISRISPSTQAAPTFETLLADDSFKIYAEIRGVGQLIRSNSLSELVDPVMKLAALPKEFKTLFKWLNAHADDLMSSRMLVAVWPTASNVQDALVALEFDSHED